MEILVTLELVDVQVMNVQLDGKDLHVVKVYIYTYSFLTEAVFLLYMYFTKNVIIYLPLKVGYVSLHRLNIGPM